MVKNFYLEKGWMFLFLLNHAVSAAFVVRFQSLFALLSVLHIPHDPEKSKCRLVKRKAVIVSVFLADAGVGGAGCTNPLRAVGCPGFC